MTYSGIGNSITFSVSQVGPRGATGATGPAGGSAIVASQTTSASLSASQSGTLFNNIGASEQINLSLPQAPSPFVPLQFGFFDATGSGIELVATSGIRIQNGSDISSEAGSFTSTGAGNLLSLMLMTPTLWVVTQITGVWDVA